MDGEKLLQHAAYHLASNKQVQQAAVGGVLAAGAAVAKGAAVIGAVVASPVVVSVGLSLGVMLGVKKLCNRKK